VFIFSFSFAANYSVHSKHAAWWTKLGLIIRILAHVVQYCYEVFTALSFYARQQVYSAS